MTWPLVPFAARVRVAVGSTCRLLFAPSAGTYFEPDPEDDNLFTGEWATGPELMSPVDETCRWAAMPDFD
jgi:hypothetical protein